MMTAGGEERGSHRTNTGRHIPVLLQDVISAISPTSGGLYIDGTFGAGGYSTALLDHPDTKLIGVDRDPDAIEAGAALVEEHGGRLTLLHGPFADMVTLARGIGITEVDGIMLDLGVSSMQLDEAERGFSFQRDGPLDMRMAQEGPSAADIINRLPEADLAQILFVLGEEKRSRAIAKAIIAARTEAPITTTLGLAEIITSVLGKRPQQKTHPATRSFQALRLYVNGELQQLAEGLAAAEKLLKEDAKLVVVTFHSLEDRIVKRFFQLRSGKTARPSRHLPDVASDAPEQSFTISQRRPILPSAQEIEQNPRARSAKLRVATRTGAAAFPHDFSNLGLPKLP